MHGFNFLQALSINHAVLSTILLMILLSMSTLVFGAAMTATLISANSDEELWSIVSATNDTAVVIPVKNVYQQVPIAQVIPTAPSSYTAQYSLAPAQAGVTVTQTTGVGGGVAQVLVKRYVHTP